MQINKHTLANGLRVVHLKDETTQMVALNILYGVGARDESPEHTGFAHLFEHLMFGGSCHVKEFDPPIEKSGGENNAWTSNDVTNYYITIPKQNLETALYLESDRMLELDFSEQGLEVQRSVVMEEFKQRCLNQPYGDVQHLIRGLAFRVHPYRWPTIGMRLEHIKDATLDEVKDFFFRFYAPDNAVLAITGNVEWETALDLVQKWFSDIPCRNVPVRHYPQEPAQEEFRMVEVRRHVPSNALFMGFHMPSRKEKGFFPCDILSDVLANGDSSRLVSHLVRQKKLFSQIDAFVDDSLDAGLFHVRGRLMPDVSYEDAEAAVWQELELLSKELVPEKELEKVKNKFEVTQVYNNMNYLNLAYSLAWFEMLSKAESLFDETRHNRAVTAEEVREMAARLFDRKNCSLIRYRKQ